jgi:hypothetical protein
LHPAALAAGAHADRALIADDDRRGSESASALDHLCDAGDLDHALLEGILTFVLLALLLSIRSIFFSHVPLRWA